jgi:hypothetical protein
MMPEADVLVHAIAQLSSSDLKISTSGLVKCHGNAPSTGLLSRGLGGLPARTDAALPA